MTATLEPLSAGEVYLLGLEPRRRARWGRVVAGALDLWCAQTGGRFELTGQGVVVVRRRSDGVAELQVPTGWQDTPDEFRDAWGIG